MEALFVKNFVSVILKERNSLTERIMVVEIDAIDESFWDWVVGDEVEDVRSIQYIPNDVSFILNGHIIR